MEQAGNYKKNDFFIKEVSSKEKRKLKALKKKEGIWSGLGMMGMIGWSVAVPSLLGAVFGIWLDKRYPQSFSWTLTFLIGGIMAGSIIAWYWIEKEDREIHNKMEENDE
jgi:ATP synthase protein I